MRRVTTDEKASAVEASAPIEPMIKAAKPLNKTLVILLCLLFSALGP